MQLAHLELFTDRFDFRSQTVAYKVSNLREVQILSTKNSRLIQINIHLLATWISLSSHHILNIVEEAVQPFVNDQPGLFLSVFKFLVFVLEKTTRLVPSHFPFPSYRS